MGLLGDLDGNQQGFSRLSMLGGRFLDCVNLSCLDSFPRCGLQLPEFSAVVMMGQEFWEMKNLFLEGAQVGEGWLAAAFTFPSVALIPVLVVCSMCEEELGFRFG